MGTLHKGLGCSYAAQIMDSDALRQGLEESKPSQAKMRLAPQLGEAPGWHSS